MTLALLTHGCVSAGGVIDLVSSSDDGASYAAPEGAGLADPVHAAQHWRQADKTTRQPAQAGHHAASADSAQTEPVTPKQSPPRPLQLAVSPVCAFEPRSVEADPKCMALGSLSQLHPKAAPAWMNGRDAATAVCYLNTAFSGTQDGLGPTAAVERPAGGGHSSLVRSRSMTAGAQPDTRRSARVAGLRVDHKSAGGGEAAPTKQEPRRRRIRLYRVCQVAYKSVVSHLRRVCTCVS